MGDAVPKARSYADDWDDYVNRWRQHAAREPRRADPSTLVYPGDEWGRPEEWKQLADSHLLSYLPESGIAVELGQGSGKYTALVLERASRVVCFDVSAKFIEVAANRLTDFHHKGALEFVHLEMQDCYEIRDALNQRSLLGLVDLFFSIDSMVHVELHTLTAYLVNASLALRRGGHLTTTLASCTTEQGFERLIAEAGWCYGGLRPSHQFYFLSPESVRFLFERLGFEITTLEQPWRDIIVVARKIRESEVWLHQP